MTVFVLHRYWDTPDNEGNEVVSAYYNLENAISDMKADANATRLHYDDDFWDGDMTWEEEKEIHFGHDPMNGNLATVYCWEIVEQEVQ